MNVSRDVIIFLSLCIHEYESLNFVLADEKERNDAIDNLVQEAAKQAIEEDEEKGEIKNASINQADPGVPSLSSNESTTADMQLSTRNHEAESSGDRVIRAVHKSASASMALKGSIRRQMVMNNAPTGAGGDAPQPGAVSIEGMGGSHSNSSHRGIDHVPVNSNEEHQSTVETAIEANVAQGHSDEAAAADSFSPVIVVAAEVALDVIEIEKELQELRQTVATLSTSYQWL